MYSILDIESTGGNKKEHRITEIAIFVHDGNKVVNQFHSLVNPERSIPPFVRRLTGITNELVSDAPYFYEVARDIVEITSGTTLVAHNVSFDYPFLRREFRNLGYSFERNTLCTLKLSRKLLPGYRSYSLGKLCDQLSINLNYRHRAIGDAEATVRLFEKLLEASNGAFTESMNGSGGVLIKSNLSTTLDQKVGKLPSSAGTYYLYDGSQKLQYIGKSNNIKNRVKQHLRGGKTYKSRDFSEIIHEIDYKVTGSELGALLKEAIDIKKYKPPYNRAQRRAVVSFGLFIEKDEFGYQNLILRKIGENDSPIIPFKTKKEGAKWLHKVVENNLLCQSKCGIYTSNGACFKYQVNRCKGACKGEEPSEEYNNRLQEALRSYTLPGENYYLIDKGPREGLKTVVKIYNNQFQGYGWLPLEVLNKKDHTTFDDYIHNLYETKDIRRIISYFSIQNRVEQVLFY